MKPDVKVERRRRAQITNVRERPQVSKKVQNLQQPRRVKVLTNWDQMLKQAADITFNRRESREVRELLEQIALIYAERDPDYFDFAGGRREWLDAVSADPMRAAHTLKVFGRQMRAPIFEQIGGMMTGGEIADGGFESRDSRAERLVSPDRDPTRMSREEFQEHILRSRGSESAQTAMAKAQEQALAGRTTTIDLIDLGGNVMDLAIPTWWSGALSTGTPEAVGAFLSGRPMAIDYEIERPDVGQYLPLAQQVLDLVDAREDLRRLTDQGVKSGREFDAAMARLGRAEQGAREASAEMEQATPYRGPDESAMLRDTAAFLTNQTNMALTPTLYPAIRTFGRFGKDAAEDVMRETAYGTLDQNSDGRFLTQAVGSIPSGTEITPELREQLRTMGVTHVGSMSQRGREMLAAAMVTEGDGIIGRFTNAAVGAGQAALRDPERAGLRGFQAAMEIVGAHAARNGMRDLVALGVIPTRNTPSLFQRGMRAAYRQLGARTLASRAASPLRALARKGTEWGMKAGARIPALQRMTRIMGSLQRLGLAQKVLGRGGQQAASRAARLSRMGRLARGMRGNLAAAVIISGAESLGELRHYMSDEGYNQLTQDIVDMGIRDMESGGGLGARFRDLVSIPESLVWSRDHARARLGTIMAQRGWGDRTRSEMYHEARQRYIIDREIARGFDQALQDVKAVLPGLDETLLHGAAAELSMNRAYTNSGRISSHRDISEYEDRLMSSPMITANLSEAEQGRVRQLVRELGAESFHDIFFFGEDTPDSHAWKALRSGMDQELPDRFRYNVRYTNWHDINRRTEEGRQRQAQRQEQAERDQVAADAKAEDRKIEDARRQETELQERLEADRQDLRQRAASTWSTAQRRWDDRVQRRRRDEINQAAMNLYSRRLPEPKPYSQAPGMTPTVTQTQVDAPVDQPPVVADNQPATAEPLTGDALSAEMANYLPGEGA